MTSKWRQLANQPDESLVEEKSQSKWKGVSNESSDDVMSWKNALLSSIYNAPKSAYRYGKNIYDAIIHPVKTGKGLMVVAESGAQALSLQEPSDPYSMGKSEEFSEKGRQKLQPFVDELKNRYGTAENFKRTVSEDPVGILADVSSILIPAGKLTRLKTVEKVGGLLEPINIIKNTATIPFKLIPEKVPISMYKSAVKFGTTLSDKQRNLITKTAISSSNQIMPTMKGLTKLRDKINKYNEQINNLINQSVKKGEKLKIDDVYKGIENLKDEFKRVTDEPIQWDLAFDRLKKQWKENLNVGKARTPQEIQRLKQNIYKDLESFYEKQKATPAKIELRKAVARNAREMLEQIIPEIKKLNKNEGELIELWDAIESKANRISNRDFISIGLPVKMGAGSGIGYIFGGESGGAAGGMIGLALGIYDTPQVKSKLALVLNKLMERKTGFNMTPTVARLIGYQYERIIEND